MASVALAHGLNANMLRSWVRAQERLQSPISQAAPAFIPVALGNAVVSPTPVTTSSADIRVEVRRANATVIVHWPVQGAAACAQWLREWLA